MFNFGCTTNERGEGPNGSCSLASVAEDMLNQREQAARLGQEGGSLEGRTTAAGVGSMLGAGVGVAASVACDGTTAGLCTAGNPAIVATGAAIGGLLGVATYDAYHAAAKAVRTLQNIHGNDLNSRRMTYVYQLVSDRNDAILKFGITSSKNPFSRYPTWVYTVGRFHMEIISQHSTRAAARLEEKARCQNYFIVHNKMPPLSLVC